MASPSTQARQRAWWHRGLLVAVVTLASTGLLAGPANAHTQLVSTDPADGSTLAAAPTTITLTFDEALLADTETISINDENGNVVASQQAKPTGAEVVVPWPAQLQSGTFQVAYRVVSGDGHPVTGAISFTIDSSGSGGASASASGVASSAPVSAATSPPASTPASVPAAEPSAAPTESGSSGVAVTLVVLGALAVLILVIIVAVTMIRRRR